MAYRYGVNADAHVIEKMTWKVTLRFVDLSELARQMYCKFCRAILDLNRIADEKQIGFACEWTIDCHCGKRNVVRSVPAEEMRDSGLREHAFSVNIKAAISIKKHSIPMHVLCNFFQDLGMPFGLEHDHQQCQLTRPLPSSAFDSSHTGSQLSRDADVRGCLLRAADSDQEPLPSPDIKVEVDDDDGLTEPMTSTSFPKVVLNSPSPRRATRGRKKKIASHTDSSFSSEVWIPCDICGTYLASESNLKSHKLSVHAGIVALGQNVTLPQGFKRKRGRPKGSKGKKNSVVSTEVMPRTTRQSPTNKVKRQKSVNDAVTPLSEAGQRPTFTKGQLLTFTKTDDNLPVTFATSVSIKKDFRRYTCRTCGKEFANLRSQKKHERSHMDELPYGCGQCNLKFRATHQLIHHIKVNHGTAFGASKPIPNAAQTSCMEKAEASTSKSIQARPGKSIHAHPDKSIQASPGKSITVAKADGGCSLDTADNLKTETDSGTGEKTETDSGTGEKTETDSGTGEKTKTDSGTEDKVTGELPTSSEAGRSGDLDLGGQATGPEGTGGESASVSARPQCSICLAYFPTTKSLFNHRRMHKEGTDLYKCTRCDRTFRFRKDLIGHLKLAHNEDFHYICPTCNKAFRNYGSLYNHKFIHDKVKKFQCGTCGRMFSRRGTLLRHELCHRRQHAYRCGICNKGYNLCQHLRQHMTSHKEHRSFKKEGPFICHKCGKIYSCSSSLHVHLMTHREGLGAIECSECGKHYANIITLRKHKRIYCKGVYEKRYYDYRDVVCQKCGRNCKTRGMYHRHVQRECGKAKYMPEGLREFLGVDAEGSYCTKCEEHFQTHSMLVYHVKNSCGREKLKFADNTSKGYCRCPMCGEEFSTYSQKRWHLNRLCPHRQEYRKKKEALPDPNSPNYHKCNHCGRGFSSRRKKGYHVEKNCQAYKIIRQQKLEQKRAEEAAGIVRKKRIYKPRNQKSNTSEAKHNRKEKDSEAVSGSVRALDNISMSHVNNNPQYIMNIPSVIPY